MDPHLLSRPASGRLRSVGREVGRFVGYGAGLGALAGLGTLAYSAGIEVRNFVVRRVEVMASRSATARSGCCTSATCT